MNVELKLIYKSRINSRWLYFSDSLGKEANLKPYPKPPLSGSLDKTPTSHTASRKRKASTPDAGVLKVRRNIQAGEFDSIGNFYVKY